MGTNGAMVAVRHARLRASGRVDVVQPGAKGIDRRILMSTVVESSMDRMEDVQLQVLDPEDLDRVQGGVRLGTVMVDGMRTGVVDLDRLEWDMMTGRIKVTYK